MTECILDEWGISREAFRRLVTENPSLRGMILGYLGEFMLRRMFENDSRASALRKDDDHDRRRKGDLVVTYRNREFIIESKSLQTNTVKRLPAGSFTGKYQCDASDRRTVTLPTGQKIETTLLLVAEFDVVSVPLYGFRQKWEFAFALNSDLQRCTFQRYPESTRKYLLASLQTVTYPLGPPYTDDPFSLFDRLLEKQRRS